jgi:hypothetical protein
LPRDRRLPRRFGFAADSLGHLERVAGQAGHLADAHGDRAGRDLGAFGELAHFRGHDGKAAPCLAGPCRFDRRIERQQVGLIGRLFSQTVLVAHVESQPWLTLDVMAQLRRVIQELEMGETELNRITAALRNLTPMQRKVVAAELASLGREPGIDRDCRGPLRCNGAVPALQRKARDSVWPRQRAAAISL